MRYLTKAHRHQNTEQSHWKFYKLVLRGKLHEAICFVYKQEIGRVLSPNDMDSDKLRPTRKNFSTVLAGKHLEKKMPDSTLETYAETPTLVCGQTSRKNSFG